MEAVASHADYMGIPRDTPMKKTLFAVDELMGFITAVALVRPSKSVMDVEPSSVRKKMKDKAFARAVSREDIVKGAEELGVPLDEHIAFVIGAMQGRSQGTSALAGPTPSAGSISLSIGVSHRMDRHFTL